MIPTLATPGVITPGQFGPTRREARPRSEATTRTMSFAGMPSVTHTMRSMPASMDSYMASTAPATGT